MSPTEILTVFAYIAMALSIAGAIGAILIKLRGGE